MSKSHTSIGDQTTDLSSRGFISIAERTESRLSLQSCSSWEINWGKRLLRQLVILDINQKLMKNPTICLFYRVSFHLAVKKKAFWNNKSCLLQSQECQTKRDRGICRESMRIFNANLMFVSEITKKRGSSTVIYSQHKWAPRKS